MADLATRPEGNGIATTIGIDLGGTFVDCVVVRSAATTSAKAPTTGADPTRGIMEALHACAEACDLPLQALLAETTSIVHGTTLGLNTLLSRRGARVGLLATRGHEDAILIGRVHQKVAGLRPHELIRAADLRKPEPLVPRWAIHGIDERIDSSGNEVVRLDELAVRRAADQSVADGCEALAIAFLWSFVRSDHERRAADIVREAYPHIPVVASFEVSPVLGEYERSAATIVNAALLGTFSGYLDRLTEVLQAAGFAGRPWVMGMTGGVLSPEMAATRPVETLRSGPVGGIMATASMRASSGQRNLIASDMGGTSFDVGLLVDGDPQLVDLTLVGQFHLAVPAVDVRSIGAGGGSIAWLDDLGGLHVGPQSAGATPGPACYGRGGVEPTVTDADLILGRLDPGAVLGRQISLDVDAAQAAVTRLAGSLGIGVVEAAAGIVRVADAQMADLLRTATIERGFDPRDFTLVAYGGAGPLHVGQFGADVGVSEAIVPSSASVFSARGLATADYRRTYRRSHRMRLPLDPAAVVAPLATIAAQAQTEYDETGLAAPLTLRYWADVRYRRQTHHLRIPLRGAVPMQLDIRALQEDFEARYSQTFGAGTGYAAAGIETTALGVDALAARPVITGGPLAGPTAADSIRPVRSRRIWFGTWIDETPVYDAATMAPQATITGPAVIEWSSTALVVHPGQSVDFDRRLDAHLRFAGDGRA